MSALLLKDWYMAKQYCRSFLFVIVLFLALSFVSGNVIFYTYPCMMAGLLPFSLYSYDEREKFTSFCAAMPVSRRQYVSEKYVFGLLASAAAAALTVIAALANSHTGTNEILPMLSAAVVSALVSQAVMLPFGFKFGVEKGRIMFIAIVAVLFAAFYVVMTPDILSSVTLDARTFSIAALVVSLLLFAASWLISQRIFEKKEL